VCSNLPALNALCNGYFLFTRQKRNSAHLPQVRANRVARFVFDASREVKLVFVVNGKVVVVRHGL
jgi:hypothetical protein